MEMSKDPPAYLPPRRPRSVSRTRSLHRLSKPATPPYLPPRRPISYAEVSDSRRLTLSSHVPDAPTLPESIYRPTSTVSREVQRLEDLNRRATSVAYEERIRTRQSSPVNGEVIQSAPRSSISPHPVTRQLSLRFSGQLKRASRSRARSVTDLRAHASGTNNPLGQQPFSGQQARHSQPPSRAGSIYSDTDRSPTELERLPAIPRHIQEDSQPVSVQQTQTVSRASSQRSAMGPKPKPSFSRISTYDAFQLYKEEKAIWKRESMASSIGGNEVASEPGDYRSEPVPATACEHDALFQGPEKEATKAIATLGWDSPDPVSRPPSIVPMASEPDFDEQRPTNRFRHSAAEIGFCFTIAMTQFLAEYMISGFAIELPKIIQRQQVESLGQFWPASLLSLILSATLLIFARISDMYGGYIPFVFGVVWLGIWSLVAGFAGFGTLLDISRAMQGLAIAAFIPSTFAMIGSIYPEGPRKNVVLGLYSGCAPLGFFAGFLVAGALPESAPGWYFWIAAALSFTTAVTAWLTVPHDRTDRRQLQLKMDWLGAILITGGLILVSYALAVEPYANGSDPNRSGWTYPHVLAPLILGLACLLVAFWMEGWYASCPLLPFDFFQKKSVKSFSLACLCFYAAYGVWLYESAQFFQSAGATGTAGGISGITLAAWYTPTAVGGLVLCVAGGALLHIVPIMGLLLVSALAWIAAPLLLALCPTPISYWGFVMPSMLCATLGVDLTFTVSVVFLSAVQPLRYQGLAGAVSSILVNLAMSFSLSISEIVSEKARSTVPNDQKEFFGFQAAFLYAAASAGMGLIICTLFVRISRSVVQAKPQDGKANRASSEASTLAEA